MKAWIPCLALCLFAATASAAEPMVLAQNDNAVTVEDLMGTEQGGTSLDEAVRQVRRETGGRILSAKTVKKGGTAVHRIKVLTPDKRVVIYEIER